jgi:hypothetical protein
VYRERTNNDALYRFSRHIFTKAAQEKNAENILIIRDQALAAPYTANWQAHAQHSQPYVGRGVRQ